MTKETVKKRKVIGIWVRTTNHESQALSDIQALWGRFISEAIPEQIPNRVNDTVYCIYTDYEEDHTKPYTTVLACEVSSLENIPEGMKGLEIGGGDYVKFHAAGDLMQGVVGEAWYKIWGSDLDRRYTNDYEVYDSRSADRGNAEVDIYVGIE